MKALLTTGLLTVALIGAVGCAEDAGVQNESDRYTVPEPAAYAAPAQRGQATGVTGEPSGAGGEDLSGQARPGTWDASRNAEIEQSTPARSPYQNLPSGTVAEPNRNATPSATPSATTPPATPQQQRSPGASVQPNGSNLHTGIPGTTSQNPGNVPPTVNNNGNTAGTSTGR